MENSENIVALGDANEKFVSEFVSIIIPVLNEENFIEAAIETVAPKADYENCEILVVDGGSSDKTQAIVHRLAAKDRRIRLLHNEKRLQSAGVNMAVRMALPAARVIVRADSHATYPPDFVKICAQKLLETGAQSIAVTMDTVGVGCFQRAVAAAQNSLLGNGGSAHRRQGASGFIDHGHHAAFDRDFFVEIGGYDETIKANEDVDLDMRIGRRGGRIWLERSIPVTYFPRDTIKGLVRQYYNYGKGRALTFCRYRYPLKLRQLFPVFSLISIVVGILLSFFISSFFLLIPISYLALCLIWGICSAAAKRDLPLIFMGGAAIVMHQAWALGFLGELIKTIPPQLPRRSKPKLTGLGSPAANYGDVEKR